MGTFKQMHKCFLLSIALWIINSIVFGQSACVNMDFEEGNRSGWNGQTGEACTDPFPCNTRNGFNNQRHELMDATMTDMYIPQLPVVYPDGGNYSIKLENSQDGGDAAIIRQTFVVGEDNAVFTYHYAVVLEDPGDHDDEERPYFRARMYDENDDIIECATYTAIAAPSTLPDYTYAQVEDPFGGGRGGGGDLDLYWKDWTTVSIPLTDYIGQTITIEFIASDCSRGGHLGYAYIDAECGPISLDENYTICDGEEITIEAPDGFHAYQWTGPGIVGADDTPQITVNASGVYEVELIPISDNPCPTTIQYEIVKECPSVPVSVDICEETKGTGIAEVTLNAFNMDVLEQLNSTGNVVSWHSETPPAPENLIPGDNVMTVNDGDIYFAKVVEDEGEIYAELTITINSLPEISFPAISDICISDIPTIVNSATPSGGVYHGDHITTAGEFAPAQDGNYEIFYTYVDENGCRDSLAQEVTVEPVPEVDAGEDISICINTPTVNLQGTTQNSSYVQWLAGDGEFLPDPFSISPSYTLSDDELSQPQVTLTLTAYGINVCPPVSDEVNINIEQMPEVDAGPDVNVCSEQDVVALAGTANNSLEVTWSGGSGVFTPSSNDLTINYSLTETDKQAGEVILTLTSQGMDLCPEVEDEVTIFIAPTPDVNAGEDLLVCANNPSVELGGEASNSTAPIWQGGEGTFSPDRTSLLATYTPSASEVTAGTTTLTLYDPGCPPASDEITIEIEPMPEAYAGDDQLVCANNSLINLQGIHLNSAGGQWIGGTGTYSPASSSPNTSYTPSETENAAGEITLTFVANGLDVCPQVSDELTISIEPIPEVDAGDDVIVCANDPKVLLAGETVNASTWNWSEGEGTFDENSTELNGTYTPSFTEIENNEVILKLTAQGLEVCPSVEDMMTITIEPMPNVFAGPDQSVCSDVEFITLSGTTENSTNVLWSGGNGVFANNNNLATEYTLTVSEQQAEEVNLILSSQNTGICPQVTDTVIINLIPLPEIRVQPEYIICDGGTTILSPEVHGQENYELTYSWTKAGAAVGNNKELSVTATDDDVSYNITVINEYDCEAQSNILVRGIPIPIIDLPDTSMCEGETIRYEASVSNISNNLGYVPQFSWKHNEASLPNNNSVIDNIQLEGIYEVSVSLGECKASDMGLVTYYPDPVSNMIDVTKFCSESDGTVELDAGSAYSYNWIATGETSRKIQVTQPGRYTVQLFNQYGCSITDDILVREVCPPRLFVSNSFSPNGDGVNDSYEIFGAHFTNFRMLIFNRWGEIIYETTDRYQPWEGFYKLDEMPIGVYPWIITYEGDTPEYKGPYKKEGSVTIVR